MSDLDLIRQAAERLVQVDEAIRRLEAEKKVLKAKLDPIIGKMFKPEQLGPVDLGSGVRAVRSLHSTKVKVDSVVEALDWAAAIGADVLVESPISKTKLDKLGVTYSDNRVMFQGEVVPGLHTDKNYSLSYEKAE